MRFAFAKFLLPLFFLFACGQDLDDEPVLPVITPKGTGSAVINDVENWSANVNRFGVSKNYEDIFYFSLSHYNEFGLLYDELFFNLVALNVKSGLSSRVYPDPNGTNNKISQNTGVFIVWSGDAYLGRYNILDSAFNQIHIDSLDENIIRGRFQLIMTYDLNGLLTGRGYRPDTIVFENGFFRTENDAF